MSTESKRAPNRLLTEARLRHGWSQQEVAERIKVTSILLGMWEEGISSPDRHACQMLCTLYEQSAQELGLPTEEELAASESSVSRATSTVTQPHATSSPPDKHRDYKWPQTSAGAWPFANASATVASPVASKPKGFDVPPRPRRKYRWPIVLTIGIICLGLIGLMVPVLTNQIKLPSFLAAKASHVSVQTSPTLAPTPVPTLVPTPLPAPWSANFAAWSLPQDWHLQGGVITTESTSANTIRLAPFHVSTPDYVVEAQIRRIGYSGTRGGQAYGILVQENAAGGYICGVGIHFTPEHFFLGLMGPPVASPYVISKDVDQWDPPAHLDNGWHTYRVEVNHNTISFFFDGLLLHQTHDNLSSAPGQLGLYVDNAAVAIRNFQVISTS